MERKNSTKLYNILLPLWFIIFIPSWLWLLLIPANYLIDRIVLKWSLGDLEDKGLFCRKHNWKICLAGFLSDFIGAALLLIIAVPLVSLTDNSFIEDAAGGIMMNPFTNVLSLIITIAAIALSAACIYLLDRKILQKAGLTMGQAKKSAIRLALITAPYLYLIPSEILYRDGF
jgi:hypothetical protein